jgi:hypothetical protein
MLFLNDPTIEIIQPEIKPFPQKTFVELVTTEKVSPPARFRSSRSCNELGSLKRVYMDVAPFFGKGTVRRSAYNDKLLKYAVTGAVKIQSVLQSRRISSATISSKAVMNTLYTKNTSIYEDFPLTHVEWHIRQQGLGDMIISKYVYPFSFGLPNTSCPGSATRRHSESTPMDRFLSNVSSTIRPSTYVQHTSNSLLYCR